MTEIYREIQCHGPAEQAKPELNDESRPLRELFPTCLLPQSTFKYRTHGHCFTNDGTSE